MPRVIDAGYDAANVGAGGQEQLFAKHHRRRRQGEKRIAVASGGRAYVAQEFQMDLRALNDLARFCLSNRNC